MKTVFIWIASLVLLNTTFAQNGPYSDFGHEGKVLDLADVVGEGMKIASSEGSSIYGTVNPRLHLFSIHDGTGALIRQDSLSLAGYARWMAMDPARQFASPYVGMGNNPVNGVDPDGRFSPSTHTDNEGNVVAVKNDGDLGVYQHNMDFAETQTHLATNYSASNTAAGGRLMGKTYFWDEFQNGGKIMFGDSWDTIIASLHEVSKGMNLLEIKAESKRFRDFDIKENSTMAPYGVNTGKLLYGQYASARSAGNFLAGYNASSGRLGIASLTLTGYMKLAGSYHVHGELTKGAIYNIIMNNGACGPAPYYGEIPYAGRMIEMGWKH